MKYFMVFSHKIDGATQMFKKKNQQGHLEPSDMGHLIKIKTTCDIGFFLYLTCDIGEN